MTQTYDRQSDYQQGVEDARNGFPRASTRPHYRRGYDRGLSRHIVRCTSDRGCGETQQAQPGTERCPTCGLGVEEVT